MLVYGGRAAIKFTGELQKKEMEALIKQLKSAAKAGSFTFSPFRLFNCTMYYSHAICLHSLFVSCYVSFLVYDKISLP